MIPYTQATFALSDDHLQRFRRDGFVKVEGLLRPELTDNLAAAISVSQAAGSRDFDKLAMRTPEIQEVIYGLVADPIFNRLLYEVTRRRLIYTQHIGFELSARAGIPWHVEFQSFGYQRKQDYGLSVWIPLTPVDPAGQAGGMAYVPRAVMSGDFVYDYVASLSGFLDARHGHAIVGDDFQTRMHDLLMSSPMREFLEHYRVEDAFAVGDVLLFDKFVLHRSVPLCPGPIACRRAYTIRFIDAHSRYDLRRVQALKVRFTDDFMQTVGERDGDPLIDSPLLRPLERRMIGPR